MKAIVTTLILATAASGYAAEYHVAINGADTRSGSAAEPFRTIQRAADLAQPGDTITVHEGVYRERVNPPRGGASDAKRIIYQAAPGEKVAITGSDVFQTWTRVNGDIWQLVVPNTYFGAFNPYAEKVHGDWFNGNGRTHRRGNVYLNGGWLPEAPTLDAVTSPAGTAPLWHSAVDGIAADGSDAKTTITARFPAGTDPNNGSVEVCVRPTVFTPEKTHIDYLTVRGFELRHAATNWAAPTAGQHGLVTAYWCKGWIIENNEISYSRCAGIALGKYSDEWDGQRGTTEGYYLTIDDALKKDGWCKEKIGGHIVRGNHIHHCGQVGIVGSLGCAFSRIEGNDIHDCNMQGIWSGAEMGGLKFHGAIDVVITNNHFHRNGPPGGLWLDWMAQGTQITGNLFHDNHGQDFFAEVNHGPFLVANNIMLSGSAFLCNSRGAAFAHNFVAGSLQIVPDGRRTPYHKPHSTEMVAMHDCPVGDARWLNNILGPRANLNAYDKAGPDWPCLMAGNVFTKGAQASRFDRDALVRSDFDPAAKLVEKADGWYLTLATDPAWATGRRCALVTTAALGKAKLPDQEFTHPDGSPVRLDTDYLGAPRDPANPFPGPFEQGGVEVKVWPKVSR